MSKNKKMIKKAIAQLKAMMKLADKHGIDMSVNSELRGGTLFEFETSTGAMAKADMGGRRLKIEVDIPDYRHPLDCVHEWQEKHNDNREVE